MIHAETELICDETDVARAGHKLLEQGISLVIITMGKEGAYVATKNCSVFSKINQSVNVIDTTGAGDCFMGNFLYKFLENKKSINDLTEKDINEYALFANICSSICISRRGALESMPTPEDIYKILNKE